VREFDIREEIRGQLRPIFDGDPRALLIDEFVVCEGTARIDLAIVNGNLIGYEIKSEKDTLARLADQAQIYSRIFDKVTVVVATKHLGAAQEIIPRWFGITEALWAERRIYLGVWREPQQNPSPDPLSMAQLLWRDELVRELSSRGINKLSGKSRRMLWPMFVDGVGREHVGEVVRECLKSREAWRSFQLPSSNGGQSQPSAKSKDCHSPFPPPRTV
jgi:hypothetical protein